MCHVGVDCVGGNGVSLMKGREALAPPPPALEPGKYQAKGSDVEREQKPNNDEIGQQFLPLPSLPLLQHSIDTGLQP